MTDTTTDSGPVAEALEREIAARGFLADDAQRGAARRLDRLARALDSRAPRRLGGAGRPAAPWRRKVPAPPQGLYLWGSVGRGKTHLMDLFYASLSFPERARSHFYRFMQQVHAELRGLGAADSPLDRVAALWAQRLRLICLDEFLVADIGDAMILGGLLEGLFARGMVLVATSNRAPEDLYENGLQRQRFLPAIALLRQHMEVVHLDGSLDYRLLELERSRLYWIVPGDTIPPEMQSLFHGLARGTPAGPGSLTVGGRTLTALHTSSAAVWFDFGALCEGPRGAADYLEIAQLYRRVFVSGVPVFDALRDDAARRFIMLIDALYEHRVIVVIAAAAGPPDLYRGDRLHAEFERTSSRLIEMQSQRYLAQHAPL